MSLIKSSLADYKEKEASKILGDYEEFPYENGKKCLNDRICGKILLIICALSFITGIILSCNDLVKILITEKTKMKPGSPSYEYWRNPTGHIRFNVYLYGIENPYAFQRGIDKKLKLIEVGPIVYSHNVHQEDIVFEDDGTLSYTTVREFKFLEKENEPGIMNKTITVINPMMLTLASKSGNYFVQYLDDVYLNRTVYELLWNGSTKLLDFFKSHFSYILPTDNFGILYNTFKQRKERYNVRIGSQNNFQDFWKINTINGKTKLANYENIKGYEDCPFSIVNASDGTGFSPYLSKNEKLKMVTARVPRYFIMEFEEEVVRNDINSYKFVVTKENYMRTHDSKDCLGNYKNIELPSGVIDASVLAHDNPLGFSPPHFYGFRGEWETYLEGLSPNKEKHESFMIIEPNVGAPLEGSASLQGNSIVGNLDNLPKLRAFSNKIIPTFWIEQGLKNLDYVPELYLLVNVIPVLQIALIVIFFLLSACSCYLGISKLSQFKIEHVKFWQRIINRKAINEV